MNARVISWNLQKGFGFLALDDGRRAFCHFSAAWRGKFDEKTVKIGDEIHFVEVDQSPKGLRVIQFVSPSSCPEWAERFPCVDKVKGIEAIKALIADLADPRWKTEDEILRIKLVDGGRNKEDEDLLFAHRLREYRKVEELQALIVDVLNVHESYSGLSSGRHGTYRGAFGVLPYELGNKVVVLAQTHDINQTLWLWSWREDVPSFLTPFFMAFAEDAAPCPREQRWIYLLISAYKKGEIVF